MISSQNLWPLDHEADFLTENETIGIETVANKSQFFTYDPTLRQFRHILISIRSYNKIIASIEDISYELSETDNKFSFWQFLSKYEKA